MCSPLYVVSSLACVTAPNKALLLSESERICVGISTDIFNFYMDGPAFTRRRKHRETRGYVAQQRIDNAGPHSHPSDNGDIPDNVTSSKEP